MNILGIETSCDETSASIVRNGSEVLSNVVATSLTEHQKFGGIIPEIASRRQLEYINIVTLKAIKDAGLTMADIDAVAVTKTPGLIGSLLVGITFAHSLAYALKKPLIHVNHIHAHIYANYLVDKGSARLKTIHKELPFRPWALSFLAGIQAFLRSKISRICVSSDRPVMMRPGRLLIKWPASFRSVIREAL
jgi:tRNA A37 threonylcarbamoyladenosine modification protein TsaB